MSGRFAIVVAGGRARRMGGTDKPALRVGGRSLLSSVLAAVGKPVVVVGPQRPDLEAAVVQVREDPPFGGPVAAIAAGLAAVPDDVATIVVVAADLPFLDAADVDRLVDELTTSGADAVFGADDRPQYLVGAWRAAYLRRRLDELGSPANLPMRILVPDDAVAVPLSAVTDCDTPDDVRAAARVLGLDVDDARDLIRISMPQLPVRRSRPREALGSVLAEPLVTSAPLPAFDTSAMDGYAIAGAGPWLLRGDVAYAGAARPAALTVGEAVRIATGARMPDGADAVLRDEFATIAAGTLSRTPDTPVRTDIRSAGEDWPAGTELAPAGIAVSPIVVSAAASAEVETIAVRGPVKAHVLVSGDEIRQDGPLQPGETRDAVGPIMPELLAACGIRAAQVELLRDTPTAFEDVLRAGTADVVIVVGATGRGAADRLRPALERLDARVVVERVRCRPGGSQVTAVLPDDRVVLGLPGNPFAAVATLLKTVPAIVDGLTGRIPARGPFGVLANAGAVAAPVTRIVPVRQLPTGLWAGSASTHTAHLAGMLGHDALAIVPPDAPDGALVELISLPR